MSDGDREATEYEVPPEPEGAPPPPPSSAPPRPRAPTVSVSTDGLRLGDFVFQPTIATETDDTHDSPQNEDRTRARDDDEHAAQHSVDGGDAPAWTTGPRPVAPRGSLDDALDAAREKAREEAARASGEAATELPILLHDPLTGKPIGTG